MVGFNLGHQNTQSIESSKCRGEETEKMTLHVILENHQYGFHENS